VWALTQRKTQEPDHRCFKRLFRTLSAEDNMFRTLIPSGLHSVVAATAETEGVDASIGALLETWWEFNEHTPFFRHPKTAQAIRMHRKRGVQQQGLDVQQQGFDEMNKDF
jgi:hypothetical protein